MTIGKENETRMEALASRLWAQPVPLYLLSGEKEEMNACGGARLIFVSRLLFYSLGFWDQ